MVRTKPVKVGMIHQAHFLPWPGYIARCLAVDVFVVLDNVNINRNEYQHRTKFIDTDATRRWLTLPIDHRTRSSVLSDVLIADSFSPKKWQRSFVLSGNRLPFFCQIWPELFGIITNSRPSLLNTNTRTLRHMLDLLSVDVGHRTPEIVLASTMSDASDRTQRLIEICDRLSLTHLVMGRFAMDSHDGEALIGSGVDLLAHRYIGPAGRAPESGVTALWDLFRLGCHEASTRYRSDWELVPVYENTELSRVQ